MTEQPKRSRVVEDVGFLGALLVGIAYGAAEALARLGVQLGDANPDHGIPWGLVIMVGALVLPKTLGRATSGKLWDAIASLLQRK